MTRNRLCRTVGILIVLMSLHCWAQRSDTFELQKAREEDEVIRQFESQIPAVQRTLFDWGGWYRFGYSNWEDVDRKVDFSEHDLRLWFSLSVDDIHQIYARVRMHVPTYYGDDAYDGDNFDIEGPDLEQGWYLLDLSNMYRRYLNREPWMETQVKVGRQYFDVGTGMVLSQILDGVRVDLAKQTTRLTVFAARTVPSQNHLDQTLPGGTNSDRHLYGVQFNTRLFARHETFAYALITRDHSDENPPDATQEYDYDSDYFGIGSTGALMRNVRYWCEATWQRGHSFANGSTTGQEDIDAFGYDVGVELLLPGFPLRPSLEAEYAFGEGDSDRISPTNSVNGNLAGTDDTGFLPFGYVDTGSSLAVRLANLQVVRVGARLHPFDFCEKLKNIEVGCSYYWYRKDEAAGGISDASADLPSCDIGRELDVYANWRIFSDLLWTARWGHFMPGDAYTDRNDRDYFMTGVVYTF